MSDSLQAHSLSKPAKFPPPECLPIKEGPEPSGDTAVGPAIPARSNREAGAAPDYPHSGCACLLLPASCPPIPQAPPHHSQSVQFSCSVVSDSEAPWAAAHQASLSITNSWSLLKLMSIESVMPSNHLLCCPLLLPPSVFPSTRVFSSESALHIRWPKYWSFSFSTSPSNEHSGLISFKMDWLDLLAVQGTLKSLLQL